MLLFWSRSALCILLVLATVACNQTEETDSISTENTSRDGIEADATSEIETLVSNEELRDGETTDDIAILDPPLSEQIELDGAEPDNPDQNELGKEKPAVNEHRATKNPQSIVADAGFSGTTTTEPTEKATEAYCLNEEATSNYSLKDACNTISKRLASVSMKSCSSAALSPTGCESVKGFPILMREFAPIGNTPARGRILLIGGTHGDELTSVSVTFKWIEKLNKHHSGLFHWHIAPLMNPDGVLKKSASRTNHNGVDLNRNMPSDDWRRNALSYWESRSGKNPRRYPGAEAASEPETQWLIDEINSFKPDAIISVHAPYGVVDFDSLLLNTAPKSLGKLHLNLLGTYPGSLGNYAGINRNIPVITLELPHSWVMPSDSETSKIWEDIVSWLRKNIDNRVAVEQTAEAG